MIYNISNYNLSFTLLHTIVYDLIVSEGQIICLKLHWITYTNQVLNYHCHFEIIGIH